MVWKLLVGRSTGECGIAYVEAGRAVDGVMNREQSALRDLTSNRTSLPATARKQLST